MRVLVNHLTPEPDVLTGLTSYLWSLMEALLDRRDLGYVLRTPWTADRVPAAIVNAPNLKLVKAPAVKNETLAALEATQRLRALAPALGCDLVFNTHPMGALPTTLPTVTVVHDLYRLTHPGMHRNRARLQWWLLTPRTLRQSAQVVAVSAATAREVEKFYRLPPTRVSVVHEASRLQREPSPPAPPISQPYALFVANITPNKDIATLVRAAQRLRGSPGMMPIVVIGRDPKGLLQAALGSADQNLVRHIEWVGNEELRAWYAHAYCYLCTSLTEGFCLPVLEAQTFGVPVICSDIPVLREVAGAGALFFPAGSDDGLAAALTSLTGNPDLRARLSSSAQSNAASFSWGRAASEMVKIFQHAVHRAR